ncbi:hypothetical protein AB3N04_15895 [Alkalihalophilus sp. As8PL]|uniref:VanW like protein n=1 Tax=Alkalihalophilus sp. As8PL TaxID=3237103 RepID=A0AB39BS28_9BACI
MAALGGLGWKSGAYETGTEIAGVAVAGMNEAEARIELEEAIQTWHEQASLSLHLFEETANLPSNVIQFEIDQALHEATTSRNAELGATVNEQRLRDAVHSLARYQVAEWVDYALFAENLTSKVNTLSSKRLSIDISEQFLPAFQLEEISVSSVELGPVSSMYLPQWVEALDGYQVEARSLFSLQDALRENRQPLLDSNGLDGLATGLFQLFGQTNIQVIERHIGLTLPAYTTAGYAASVSPSSMDFKAYNPNHYTYELSASLSGDRLLLALIGKPFIHEYQLSVEEIEEIHPRTIVHFSPTRRIGDKQVMSEGEIGYSAHVYHIERSLDGEVIVKKKIGIDYYPPQHKIEEWSLQEQPATEEEQNPAGGYNPIFVPTDPNQPVAPPWSYPQIPPGTNPGAPGASPGTLPSPSPGATPGIDPSTGGEYPTYPYDPSNSTGGQGGTVGNGSGGIPGQTWEPNSSLNDYNETIEPPVKGEE